MAVVKTWFPTSIYYENNLIDEKENFDLRNHCLQIQKTTPSGGKNWRCPTYNTLGTYNIIQDSKFCNLINHVTRHLNEFVKMHGSNYQYTCKDAWINIYKNSDYQEYHIHSNNTFSAVYYIDVPKNSGAIVWKSPLEPDMLPIKDIVEFNDLSFRDCFYYPKSKDLVIFRSFVPHMVEPGKNNSQRISIAFNF